MTTNVRLHFDDGSIIEIGVSRERRLVRVESGIGSDVTVNVLGPPPPPLPRGGYLRQMLDAEITDLGLSVRATNVLAFNSRRGEGLTFVGELVRLTERDILMSKNAGRKVLEAIQEALWERRLSLAMNEQDCEGWTPPKEPSPDA